MDIVLNGVSVADLKRQKEQMRESAAKFMADGIANATTIVRKILDEENTEDVDGLAQEATDILEQVELVAGASGMTYYLPYNEEYGEDDSMANELDNAEHLEIDWRNKSPVYLLRSRLENMEYDSRMWHSSTC